MSEKLEILSGVIENYSCARASANFFFADEDFENSSAITMSAAVLGLGAQAIGSHFQEADAEEISDRVEFYINGKLVKAWLWRSPFKDGDAVEVVAMKTKSDFEFEGYAVARPKDRIVALYPHLSRGRISHFIYAIKLWLLIGCLSSAIPFFYTVMASMLDGETVAQTLRAALFVLSVVAIFLFVTLLPLYSISNKYMKFVRSAEFIFNEFGWPKPKWIDLRKITAQKRTPQDSDELGNYYFKY